MVELREGTELENRYVIHEVIGAGGTASVWKASDKQLNRSVALKRLQKRYPVSSSDEMAGALQEARKHAQLIHTNIVQVYDVISVDDEHLIVMEYVDGPSLYSLLRERARGEERFAIDQAVAILKEILAGLDYAHSKSVCHRDLSPMNILITSSGVPKIADFGIARVLGQPRVDTAHSLAEQGGTGNPSFMSPEQARGEPADFSSDLFMAGIIGYLLLAGRHPFAHPTGLFLIPELIADPDFVPETPKPPSGLGTRQQRLFREYAAVVMRLIHREKAGRFGTAREVITAIDAVTPSLDCPACGERVPEHHQYCGFCASRLVAELQVSSAEGVTPTQLVNEGFQLTREQRWTDAIPLYRKAIEIDPGHQRAHWSLGYALNHLGRHEEAIAVLEKGLALPTSSAEHQSQFYYALAFANANLKNYELALQQIETALQLQPGSTKSVYLRAKIHVYCGHLDDALEDGQEVLRRDPDHPGAIRLLEELGSPTGWATT